MRKAWWIADSVVSSLGTNTSENYANVASGKSGLGLIQDPSLSDKTICVSRLNSIKRLLSETRFETLALKALKGLREQVDLPQNRTLFILSTTKGNIELLEQGINSEFRIHLHQAMNFVTKNFKFSHRAIVSNACASGVSALILAKRQIECGNYDHAVVLGVDALSKFIISGFHCLNALSDSPCRPFDVNRAGINLGEAAACVLISSDTERFQTQNKITISGGALSNDANHISGPSKTGEELALAIGQALRESKLNTENVDFISAHGTATIFNDEMESKSFCLSRLTETPVHSLKGYFGHTLGAAGVLESIMSVKSLAHQELLASKGFETLGVSKSLNISRNRESKAIQHCLKTSSGFGGCNAAIVITRES